MWRMHYSAFMNLPRLPGIVKNLHRMADQPDRYTEQEIYDYVRYVVGLMKKTGFITTEAFGEENLPKEGGYVLYPNHQGKYDAYSIVDAHKEALTVVMDREMSYFIFVAEILDALRGKRMDIRSSRQAHKIISEVAQEVAQGRRYIIFPEGAYDDDKHNALWDFKPGCFKAAVRAGSPIIPVALVDSYKVYNSKALTPVKTQVHFLEPLYPQDYKDLNTYQIADIVKTRIAQKLEQLGCK